MVISNCLSDVDLSSFFSTLARRLMRLIYRGFHSLHLRQRQGSLRFDNSELRYAHYFPFGGAYGNSHGAIVGLTAGAAISRRSALSARMRVLTLADARLYAPALITGSVNNSQRWVQSRAELPALAQHEASDTIENLLQLAY
jgi:hypothetical protein